MEEDCGGGQGLSWAVEPRGEREREISPRNYLASNEMNEWLWLVDVCSIKLHLLLLKLSVYTLSVVLRILEVTSLNTDPETSYLQVN
jgi:ABC-type protease/lipase transport system fused ATPase/permease subunit